MTNRDPIEVNFFVPLTLSTCEGLSWAVVGELLQILENSYPPLYPDTMSNYNNMWLQDENSRETIVIMNRLGGQISEKENIWTLAYHDPRLAALRLVKETNLRVIPRRRTAQSDMCFKIADWLMEASPILEAYERGNFESSPDSYTQLLPARRIENFGNYDEDKIDEKLLKFIPESWRGTEPRWLNLLIESDEGPTGVANMQTGEYQSIHESELGLFVDGTPLRDVLAFREDGFPGATLGSRIFGSKGSDFLDVSTPSNLADLRARHLRKEGYKVEVVPMLTCPNVEQEWLNIPKVKIDYLEEREDYIVDKDFEIVAARLRKESPADSSIVPGSLPILSFGDHKTPRVVTIGLNPSDQEFLNKDVWLTGENRRVPSLLSIGVDTASELTDEQVSDAYHEQISYFSRNPLTVWFNAQNKILKGALKADYFDGTASHLDLVQWATSPKQSALDAGVWRSLVEADREFLEWQLRTTNASIVVMISQSTVKALVEAGIAPALHEVKLQVEGISQTLTFYFGASEGKIWLGWNLALYQPVAGELVDLLIETIKNQVNS